MLGFFNTQKQNYIGVKVPTTYQRGSIRQLERNDLHGMERKHDTRGI